MPLEPLPDIDIYAQQYAYEYYNYNSGYYNYAYGGSYGGISASVSFIPSSGVSSASPPTSLPRITVAAATSGKSTSKPKVPTTARTRAADTHEMKIVFDKNGPIPDDVKEFLEKAVPVLVEKFGNQWGRTLQVTGNIDSIHGENRNNASYALNFTYTQGGPKNDHLYIGPKDRKILYEDGVYRDVYNAQNTQIQSVIHELVHVFFPGISHDGTPHSLEFYQKLDEVITVLKNAGFDIQMSQHDYDYWLEVRPVVLDLDGNGIEISPLSSSNTFFDTTGGGYQHRTAWAGAGDAVLAFDANNDGVINQKNEIVFTEWDPSATSDMQALRHVFDTNHNGRLDSGDAQLAQFKLLVTNADGTQTLETLAQAGVASIDLKEDNSSRIFSDGSSIDGQTIFTRTDGTTGTAASVSFVTEALGYRLQTAGTKMRLAA